MESYIKRYSQEFIHQINILSLELKTDECIDYIYDFIDNLLITGRFDVVDVILLAMVEEKSFTDLLKEELISILIITLAAKDILNNREKFISAIIDGFENKELLGLI